LAYETPDLAKLFGGKITGSIDMHWSSETSHTEEQSRSVGKTFETAHERFTSRTETFTFSVGGPGYPTGLYRYTTFGTCYVYVTLVFDLAGNVVEKKPIFCYPEDEYDFSFDVTAQGAGFSRAPAATSWLSLTQQDINRAKACAFAPNVPTYTVADTSNRVIDDDRDFYDVWGAIPGRFRAVDGYPVTYTYYVINNGRITGTLVGGGSGGTGAIAARDADWGLFGSKKTRADAGWSAAGGNTVLRLKRNNVVIDTKLAEGGKEQRPPSNAPLNAQGHAGRDGPDTSDVDNTEKYTNGKCGYDGQEVPLDILVFAGDIITIEVGYGGGGSGGAANNDSSTNYVSSGGADMTLGSEGSSQAGSGCGVNASRGGMGAMHSIFSPQSPYQSDLQKGSNSSAVGNSHGSATWQDIRDHYPDLLGGNKKGAGGAAGDEFATGGMYATGGGGGAAGGFTMESAIVALEPMD
jgi:hypothetical protein